MDLNQKDKISLATANNVQNNSREDEGGAANNSSSFLSAKLDKLSSAVYLVTDFLSDNEPLKWDLRKSALNIIGKLSDIKYRSSVSANISLGNISREIEKTISLLSVGMNISGVSRMNFSVLKQEFENAISLINDENQFSNSLKKLPEIYQISSPERKDKTEEAPNEEEVFVSYKKENTTTKVGDKKLPKIEDKKPLKTKERVINNVSDKKADRRDLIVEYVKNHGWSSIADIGSVDSSCSLKTIQRELSSLVDRGVLKKKGERRWSRYQVA